ncbi:MAG: c-type cytochrome [Gammaproteobacteria bacterium]|nr:c-type cytochrome [Gammaproteobacteria bacterium]
MNIPRNTGPIAAGVLSAALLCGTAAMSLADQDVPTGQDAAANETSDPRLLAQGKRLYILCQACHATEADPGDKIGPHLAGIVDRPVASAEGSVYSDALRAQDFVWSEENLDIWLQRPAEMVPGTSMSFAGLPGEELRRALIAYLNTL